ncbi:MAG: hypothetical protein A3J52_00655 [Omnitrophica bacterium RIFCSPHIGHO2_02_FULL_49_9]|nr:MAG: hypothetical protein A3J52_00655 [Omnitrophica bacterium RIFCSPHIGHO2_02_FULL_49_9]
MNPNPKVGDIIDFSWSKTKEILFPFELKRWARILVITWLAGQASGLGGNFNLPRRPSEKTVEPTRQVQTAAPTARYRPTERPTGARPNGAAPTAPAPSTPSAQPQSEAVDDTVGIPQAPLPETSPKDTLNESFLPALPAAPPIQPGWWLFLIPLLIGFVIFFTWISARFNFIFLEAMTQREVKIRESFRAYKSLGNSYFAFSLCLIGFIALVILVSIALASAFRPALWLSMAILFILLVVVGIVGTLVSDFVLPVMLQDRASCFGSCQKFLSLKPRAGQLVWYVLLKIALGIVASLIAIVVSLGVGLIVVVAASLVALPGALIVRSFPFLQPLFMLFGILLVILAVIALVVFLGLILLPIPVFFRALALTYLAGMFPDYNLLGFAPRPKT